MMELDSHSHAERVAEMTLTPLNVETTLRWLACQASDTHRSGQRRTLIRPIKGYWEAFTVCDSCGVPIAPAVSWRIRGQWKDLEDVA
jgi:hypothetical protein